MPHDRRVSQRSLLLGTVKEEYKESNRPDKANLSLMLLLWISCVIALPPGVAAFVWSLKLIPWRDSVFRWCKTDGPVIAKDDPPLVWIGLACIQHADKAQFSRCPGEAFSSSNDIGGVAIICDCVNARESANLIRVRCCILRKYCVAGLGYPMMVHFCDGGITCG